MCIYIFVCICVCMIYTYMYIFIIISTYIYIYFYVHIYVYLHVCADIYMQVCMYSRTNRRMHGRMYVCMYACMCTRMSVCQGPSGLGGYICSLSETYPEPKPGNTPRNIPCNIPPCKDEHHPNRQTNEFSGLHVFCQTHWNMYVCMLACT